MLKILSDKSLSYFAFCWIMFYANLQAQEHICYPIDERSPAREKLVDFTHLQADLQFEPLPGKVFGKIVLSYICVRAKTDSLILDGPNISIQSMALDGFRPKWYTKGDQIIVKIPNTQVYGSEHKLSISYEAQPKKGIYFIGWKDSAESVRKQIWTQGQGIDNRHWLPIFDDVSDKITTDITIYFDKSYQVLSNGKLKSKKSKGEQFVWNYIMEKPHSPYLIMIAIGNYDIKTEKSNSGIPLNMYMYPDWSERMEPTYRGTKALFDWMENLINVPYPWPSYSQVPVQDFLYGAMENTSATIFGDFFCTENRSFKDFNYVYVNAHELAHQWFGNLITSRSPHAHWLHESFATYFHTLWEKEFFGEDHFEKLMWDNQTMILKEAEKNHLPIVHSRAGSIRHYQKGAWILNMLRNYVGEEDFYRVLSKFLQENAYKNVTTHDLLHRFHEHAGYSLDWFWNQWILRGGEPHLKVSYSQGNLNNQHQCRILIEQIQERNEHSPTYRLPIDIAIYYKDNSMRKASIEITEATQFYDFYANPNSEVKFVIFDVGNKILKKLTFERNYEALSAQCREAENMIDRYEALSVLRDIPIFQKRDLLKDILYNESSQVIIQEAIGQLQQHNDPYALPFIKTALMSNNSNLKVSILQNTQRIDAMLLPEYEIQLADSSYQVIAIALELLCSNFPNRATEYLDRTKNINGAKAMNVRIKWLEISWLIHRQSKDLDELIAFTAYGNEFLTRISAAQTLQNLNQLNEELTFNLMDGITNPNGKLSKSFGNTLKYFYSQFNHQQTIQSVYSQFTDATDRTKINKYLK